jgi:hypothetical protein
MQARVSEALNAGNCHSYQAKTIVSTRAGSFASWLRFGAVADLNLRLIGSCCGLATTSMLFCKGDGTFQPEQK